ncbi:MAG TPA: Uma2 family endonuclease [Tepidisphaeraceae bacterium]|jgi:Uma2 family endonuclease|nr:Uma2 family endonuclease [Tepidisphaeraceae bacterium]
MVVRSPSTRLLVPGTTGWSVRDLDDPQIERQWENAHYEIIEGVLTEMAPAYYDGAVALANLEFLILDFVKNTKLRGHFAHEVDFILASKRVVKPDSVFMTPEDERRQKKANAKLAKPRMIYGRLLLPPTLCIESVSLRHEAHDRETKRAWYAEFGVRNYWLLDAQERTLECLVLKGSSYRVDQAGQFKDTLRPSLFPSLVINLADIWLD